MLIDSCRVFQHHLNQVPRSRGAVNGTGETLPDQIREIAAMIDVCVADEHRINCRGVKAKVPVSPPGILSPPTSDPTVKKKAVVAKF